MFGLDERLAALADGGSLLVVLIVAGLLGLRHATDPDHLTAVSALMLSDGQRAGRRATVLGLSWGLGHATTLTAFGLPVVAFGRHLPPAVQMAAEIAVGTIIVALSLRLLVRWRRGYLHAHPHAHGPVTHSHPHVHEHAAAPAHADLRPHEQAEAHQHRHAERLGRTPGAAYAVGLVHGTGGSAGVGVLLIGAFADQAHAVAALVVLSGGTALAMAAVSSAFGHAIGSGAARRMEGLTPSLGVLSLLFGIWYTLGVVGAVPYGL